MTPIRHLAAAAAAVALSLACATPASASVERFFDHPKGMLSVPTELHSSSGCVQRAVTVFPFVNPDGGRSVWTEVDAYDSCADQPVLARFGRADLAPDDVAIGDDLTSASLTVTVPAFDGLADGFPPTDPIEIDLRWIGSGRIHESLTRYADGQLEGATIVNHDHEACRDATVAGSVVSGGVDYAAGATADTLICRQTAGSLFLFVGHP